MTALVKAAKKEGHLNVVALPNNWANYGNIIKDFEKKYGIKINSENPEGSSAEEIQAIQSRQGTLERPRRHRRRNELRGDGKVRGTARSVQGADVELDPRGAEESELVTGSTTTAGTWPSAVTRTTVTNCPTSFKQMSTETGAQGYKIGLNNSPLTSNSALAARASGRDCKWRLTEQRGCRRELLCDAEQEWRLRQHDRGRHDGAERHDQRHHLVGLPHGQRWH